MTWRMVWRFLAFMLLLCAAAVLFAWAAQAHEFWINGYKSPIDGVHCCGEGDCFPVPDDQMRATAAGWLIVPTGEVVPYSESQASEDGKFWRCKRHDGSRRCFFSPQPAS